MDLARIDKNALLETVRARLAGQLERLTSSQKSAQDGATHPDARQEHAKDMRSTESSYLARGLAERVETLRDGLRQLELVRARGFAGDDAAGAGALVRLLDDHDRSSVYFLAPAGAGEEVAVSGMTILVITPRSPLGSQIAGRQCGDRVVVDLPSGTLRAEIDAIA
jgi:transcription elongation GreA/GreB family factor